MATSASSESSKEKGFMLLELLVVIGITVVLLTIVIGYSRESSRQLALANTQAKMINLVNRAKFLSIETYLREGKSGDKQICAYGVAVDLAAQEMFIFQDLSSEPASNPRCRTDSSLFGNNNDGYDEGERLGGELNEFNLRDAPVAFAEDTTLREVVFIPPDPQTKINKSDSVEANVGVKAREGNGRFTITVNNAGQIKAK